MYRSKQVNVDSLLSKMFKNNVSTVALLGNKHPTTTLDSKKVQILKKQIQILVD